MKSLLVVGVAARPVSTSSSTASTFAPHHETHLHERGRLSKPVSLMQYSRGVRGTRPELPQSREQPLFCMHPDNGVCSHTRLELAWSDG